VLARPNKKNANQRAKTICIVSSGNSRREWKTYHLSKWIIDPLSWFSHWHLGMLEGMMTILESSIFLEKQLYFMDFYGIFPISAASKSFSTVGKSH